MVVPATMQALRLHRFGPTATSVRMDRIAVPALRPNEILIAVSAASINPIDYKIIHGALRRLDPMELPARLGFDACGTVVAVGEQIIRFKPGMPVFVRLPRNGLGSFAEYCVAAEDIVALKPAKLSAQEAAALPLVGLTVMQALEDHAHARKGERILIHAGSGGVGSIAIQYARLLGLEITTTASARNAEWVRALGADHVIAYDQTDYRQTSTRFDIVFDTLGGAHTRESFKLVRLGGVVVSIAGPPDHEFIATSGAPWPVRQLMRVMSWPIYRLARKYQARYHRFLTQSNGAQLARLARYVESGALRPVLDRSFAFADWQAAFAYAEQGHTKGKVILDMPGANPLPA